MENKINLMKFFHVNNYRLVLFASFFFFSVCMWQVFLAAFRKRKLSLPENLTETQVVTDGSGTSVEFTQRTSDFK